MRETLRQTKLVDAHTHIYADHPAARGIADILLYHMVVSDLYSAGCPGGARLSNRPTEDEVERRVTEALPYLPYIRNTSCFWGVRMILKDLYGWEREITADNWRELDALIKSRGCGKTRAKEIMDAAGILRSNTEIARRGRGDCDDLFTYAMEWSFFTRSQWGVFDTALIELEYAWNMDEPGDPLPVTADLKALHFAKKVGTVEDVDAAITHYIDRTPFDQLVSITSHLSTDISYRTVSRAEMASALERREQATERERDIYANYIFEAFLSAFEKSGADTLLQFSIGAEPLPFETGSKLRSETVFEIASVIARHPGVRFNFYLANMAQNQALCTLARELPNVSLTGCWWHNFFPSYIKQIASERLDMVAANKQIGFFSDAYCMDWSYAKSMIIRECFAGVFAERIDRGQYTRTAAEQIAREIFADGPARLLGIGL